MRKSRTTNPAGCSRLTPGRMKTARILAAAMIVAAACFCAHVAQAFVHEDRVTTAKGLAHYMMGHRYDLLGQTNYAVLEYEKAVQFDEGNFLIHLRLGTGYARLNMLPEAIEHLTRANQLNPEDMQSHYLLALIYSNQHEYDKAAQEYELILKRFAQTEPQNVEIYQYLGQLYYSQRKYDQAVTQFEKILTLEPNNADVMYMLGSLYVEINKKDRAIEILKKSIGVDPNHDGSLNTLGYLYTEEGKNLDEALGLINRALKIDPDNGAYLDSLGWVYYKMGKYDQALSVLMEADAHLKDPVIYDHLGDVSRKLNHMDEAIRYWKLSLQLSPDQTQVQQKIETLQNAQASR